MPISKVLMCKMHKRIITQNVGSTVVSEDCMRSHVTSVTTSWTFGINRRTYWKILSCQYLKHCWAQISADSLII